MVFDEIYEKYFASIIFVCQKFCDSKEDAEEVAQDTFVIASKKLDHIKTDTTLAYLRKIAIRESYRKHNANNHRQQLIVASDEALANYKELDEDFLPEEALQNKEKRARLVGTVEALPKTQRDMVYMYYFADLSVAEIASLMDCSAHNVRQTLYVAKKTLKSRLEKEFGGRVFKSLALVSIGALLLSEEQAFAASYAGALGANPPPAPRPINYYFIGASVLALCAVVAASLYFALRP
ncbi:MAG: sigma-70 family RNA polymerase sigma factor, partial [Defluviitaleaceae bacterium]|nr:sigma-70 family RNA polymerase sigma factor [Defluviitaleaceae bacterium]